MCHADISATAQTSAWQRTTRVDTAQRKALGFQQLGAVSDLRSNWNADCAYFRAGTGTNTRSVPNGKDIYAAERHSSGGDDDRAAFPFSPRPLWQGCSGTVLCLQRRGFEESYLSFRRAHQGGA